MRDNALDRALPASPDAERMVLAAIMLDTRKPNECFLAAQQKLETDDFSLDSHRRIFRAMAEIHDAGKSIEYITLCGRLEERKEVEACGGIGYITDLVDPKKMPRLKNIDVYLEILQKHTKQRKIIHATDAAMRRAYEQEDPEETAGALSDTLRDISERSQSQALEPLSKIVPVVAAELVREFDAPGDFIGLPTGIPMLNETLGGLVERENVIVAADPGGGKTAMALNIAEYNFERGTPVAYFSLELTKKKLLIRLAARRSGVPQFKLRNKKYLTYDERVAILEELENLKHFPMWIDDRSGLTPRQIYAAGRMIAAKGAKLLITDYIQKINAPGGTIREQTNHASEAVRRMYKDGYAAGLTLSQLSRPPEKGLKGLQRKPTMHDLRESGALEADADSVALLWREREEDPSDKTKWKYTGQDAIIIGKNRNGPEGELAAYFDPVFMYWAERFTGSSPDHKAAAAGCME